MRTLVRALGAAALALALSGPIAQPVAAQDAVKIGLLSLTSHAPSIIAEGKGYFDEAGIDADFVMFQAAQPMAVAIASGDIDFGMTAISGGLVSLADKGAVKVIGGALEETADVPGQKILVSKAAFDAGVTTPADLAGRSFALTTAGSSFHYMAHKIADGAGFDRSSLRMVPLQKVPAVIAALRSGQVDAWSIVPNIADGLTRGGDVVEIGKVSDFIPDYQVTAVFTSTRNVESNEDLVRRFLAALSKGIDDYNAALVDRTMGEDETAAIVGMIHRYVYNDQPLDVADPRIRAGAMRVSPGAALDLASVEDQLEWFKSEGLVPARSSIETLVDSRFVETN